MGYPLVIRTSRGCTLTKAGEILAEKGIKLIKNRDILLNEMAEAMKIQNKEQEKLRFGLANCYSETILLKFLPQFLHLNNDTNIDLLINKTDVLEKMCINGEVDIVLTQKEYCDPRLECFELTQEKLVVFLPTSYFSKYNLDEYDTNKPISLKKLEVCPTAECQGHPRFQTFVNQYYEEVAFKPNVVFQSESWLTIISLIKQQMCYCIMPDIFDFNDKEITKLNIDSKYPTSRTLSIAYRPRTKLPLEWSAFMEFAKDCLK